MKNLVILWILMVLTLPVHGKKIYGMNPVSPDSLRKKLTGATIPESITLLNALANWYAPVNYDSSIMYSAQAMRLGTANNDQAGVGISMLNTGNACYYRMDLKNALLSYLSALKILEELKPAKELGELYMQLGNINYYIGRTGKSVSYYRLASQCFDAIQNDLELLQAIYATMFTYLMANQFDSTVYYGNQFMAGCDQIQNQYLKAHGLNVLGWAYSAMKDPKVRQKALDCNYESLEIGKALGDSTLMAINYLNLGNNFDRGGWEYDGAIINLPLARSFHQKAYQAAEKARLYLLMGATSNYLAAIDIEERQFKHAEHHLHNSKCYLDTVLLSPYGHSSVGPFYSFGKMVDYILAQQHRAYLYDLHYKLESARGRTNKATEFLHLFYQYSDSIYARQQVHQFELIMAEAEAEKADQKIRTLSQANELRQLRMKQSLMIFMLAGGVILFISMALLMFIYRKRSKAEQKSVLMEQRLLRARMNPHFLYNSLASIQNYILNERPDEASTYLSRFSQLVRDVLDNSVEEFVLLRSEINAIQNYLELQKARYEDQFTYILEIDDRLDPDSLQVPPMLAQPFIENAIEHGVKYKETTGHIRIRFMAGGDLIRFEVEDDGVGRQKAYEIESKYKTKHRPMSTSITIERLTMLGKKYRKKFNLEIFDLKDDHGNACGTKVTFGIPVVGK